MQKALRFHPPAYNIRFEEVPIPSIRHPDDAIIKIKLAGRCGSDLHPYRGHQPVHEIHTCGHEFVGEVIALGASFSTSATTARPILYSKLRIGDKVVCPFTTSCGECQPCQLGFSGRCVKSLLLGSPALDGGQAQYIRIPWAGGTLVSLSDTSTWPSSIPIEQRADALSTLSDASLLLLADILPTGLFAAIQAINHPKLAPFLTQEPWPTFEGLASTPQGTGPAIDKLATFAIIGLGPVGICALVSLIDCCASRRLDYRILGVDLNRERREKLLRIYEAIQEPWKQHGQLEVCSPEDSKVQLNDWTKGIGYDAVLEVVGNTAALRLSYELVRPFGMISSVGAHSPEPLPFSGSDCYDKNISIDFGRCPARALFPAALDLLGTLQNTIGRVEAHGGVVRRQDVLGGIGRTDSLIDRIVGLEDGVESYRAFDRGEVGKILFDPWG